MADQFIGEIRMFAGNFAPREWAFCDGRLMPISQYQALYSILGTTYGGDGRTDFALPDLRGRVPLHPGSGPGLTERRLGEEGGSEQVTLSEAEIPGHSHGVTAAGDGQTVRSLSYFGTQTEVPQQTTGVTDPTGGGQPHDNMPPFQAVNFIIAIQGMYPSRS
jgi:microcystin-dependent protein